MPFDNAQSNEKNHRSRRLFFALWPTDVAREALMDLQNTLVFQGRPVPAENFHVTLVFLGAVEDDRRACIEQAAAGVVAPPFELCLDRVAGFPRTRVIWSGASRTPSALLFLVEELQRALAECGFVPEARPFTTHLTLFRQADKKALKPVKAISHNPVQWPVTDFSLVQSLSAPAGVRYRVLHRWPLRDRL